MRAQRELAGLEHMPPADLWEGWGGGRGMAGRAMTEGNHGTCSLGPVLDGTEWPDRQESD